MSSTSEALVQLAEQKEALRVIANRYLDQQDRLSVDCTLQDIIDVLNEYDEYSYMNAFLNSIEVFPDKDYSINDTEGHIKGLRPYAFYRNTALKSVHITATLPSAEYFSECSNIETFFVPKILGLGSGDRIYCTFPKVENLNLPFCVSLARRQFSGFSSLKSLMIGSNCTGFNQGSFTMNIDATHTPLFRTLIVCDAQQIMTMSSAVVSNLVTLGVTAYVPASINDSTNPNHYPNATNWTVLNASYPIQDIESHINYLRELGADFSYTPYANKKWENNQLVDDPTIGEEVDE